MLTLAANASGQLQYLLTDNPTPTQADGLAAWRNKFNDLTAAHDPDWTAEPGHECDAYAAHMTDIECVMRATHEFRQCDDVGPEDAAFMDAVVKAFSEWIEADSTVASHWREEFAEVLELFAAA